MHKSPPPPVRKSRVELEREKRARQIDRENAILLRKLQSVRPAVAEHIYTSGRGAAYSVCAWDAAPAPPPVKQPWCDPTSQGPPPPPRRSPNRDRVPVAGGGGFGGGGASNGPRTRMFKDPALVGHQASREDHLYE